MVEKILTHLGRPVFKARLPFLAVSAALLAFGLVAGWRWLTLLGLLAGAFFTYFFRDPERPIPQHTGAVVSPADGKVVLLDEVREGRFLKAPAKRVGIFMDVFDVHVNRAPVSALVLALAHRPGRFVAAFRREADELNEQQAWLLEDEVGRRLLMVQIAGLLARRIIPFAVVGRHLARGERLGMICFGSRVDLYLPPEAELLIKVGDRVKAGSSVLARLWTDAA